jgi:hypothetical protein
MLIEPASNASVPLTVVIRTLSNTPANEIDPPPTTTVVPPAFTPKQTEYAQVFVDEFNKVKNALDETIQ